LRNRKHRVTDTRHGSGSLQPGRPPTNTLFNTPDTERDRSNTVRVIQIIHRNLGLNLGVLECPKRCRAQELAAAIVLLTLMFHTVLVWWDIYQFSTQCASNRIFKIVQYLGRYRYKFGGIVLYFINRTYILMLS